jgi:hypothetical protein
MNYRYTALMVKVVRWNSAAGQTHPRQLTNVGCFRITIFNNYYEKFKTIFYDSFFGFRYYLRLSFFLFSVVHFN